MSKLLITWPKAGPIRPVGQRRLIVASGKAAASVVGVRGKFWPESEPHTTRQAHTLACTLANPRSTNESLDYAWLMALEIPAPGRYTLEVTGYLMEGERVHDSCSFDIAPESPDFVDISWPASDTDITDEASNFSPYGDLSDTTLELVTLTDQNNLVTYPTTVFSDPIDFQLWSAQFPALSSGTYTLTVTDSNGGSPAEADGLVVD